MSSPSLIAGMLPDSQKPQTKLMRYDAQVVWCLDPNDPVMFAMASDLHGKRVAAGEGAKSEIVRGQSPAWPAALRNSQNVRLYVVAHGIKVKGAGPPTVKIDVGGAEPTNARDVDGFFPLLRDLIHKSPARRVARISLSMCNSAGIKGTLPAEQSFAKKLADQCSELASDLTGRMGTVFVRGVHLPEATVKGVYDPNPNPFYTYMVETAAGRASRSVLNARKQVEDYQNHATYIFKPKQAPVLKPGYSE